MRKKLSRISRVLGRFGAEPAVGLADFAVQRRGLVVFPQTLQCRGLIELDDVAVLAAVLGLVVVQTNQCGLHDVDAR